MPKVDGPPAPQGGRAGAAPGRLATPDAADVEREFDRRTGHGAGALAIAPSNISLSHFYSFLSDGKEAQASDVNFRSEADTRPVEFRKHFDPSARQHRQFDQLVAFTQN